MHSGAPPRPSLNADVAEWPTSAVNAGSISADTYLRVTKTKQTLISIIAAMTLVGVAAPAQANVLWVPGLLITGDATAAEHTIIRGTWSMLKAGLPAANECLTDIEVRVVDRAETYFTSGNFAIASFYRAGAEPIIFIEHGKVTPANVAHEFAHHIDLSCALGDSDLATEFQQAAGFDPSHEWYHGSRWTDVPAEHFAEAILSGLSIGPLEIDVRPEAVELVMEHLTARPTQPAPTPQQ